MANRARKNRPVPNVNDGQPVDVDELVTGGYRLWVAGTVVEKPVGDVVHFGPVFVVHFGPVFIAARDEQEALSKTEEILERAYPSSDGYVHTFDVVEPAIGDLEFGVKAGRRAGVR